MDSEYDPEREAMAAIELAGATNGADRRGVLEAPT
jgi:hypothetical protein